MSARYQQPEAITWQWGYIPAAASSIGFTLLAAALLALLAGLCCKLPKVLSVVSRLALTAALAAGLCLNGGYLRGVVRTHHAENLAAYQFFVVILRFLCPAVSIPSGFLPLPFVTIRAPGI